MSVSDGACLAQSGPNDPLNNAKVWQMLASSPTDSALWASYLGKPWIGMTYEEKEKIFTWQSQLKEKQPEMVVEVFDNADDDNWGDEVESIEKVISTKQKEQLADEQKSYVRQLEKMFLQKPPALSALQDNILANFIIIEDIYSDEFAAMGSKYRFYASAHPDGRYNKEAWVQEKYRELMQLKRQRFERMKEEMLSSSR